MHDTNLCERLGIKKCSVRESACVAVQNMIIVLRTSSAKQSSNSLPLQMYPCEAMYKKTLEKCKAKKNQCKCCDSMKQPLQQGTNRIRVLQKTHKMIVIAMKI